MRRIYSLLLQKANTQRHDTNKDVIGRKRCGKRRCLCLGILCGDIIAVMVARTSNLATSPLFVINPYN
jgi:hypothetical protein